MKIATRITLASLLLMLVALGVHGGMSLHRRQQELYSEREEQIQLAAAPLTSALEAALREGRLGAPEGRKQARTLIGNWQAAYPNVRFTFIDLDPDTGEERTAHLVLLRATAASRADLGPLSSPDEHSPYSYAPAPFDATRIMREQRVLAERQPFGHHLELDGKPAYALLAPLRDKQGRILGAIELVRDESDVIQAMSASRRTLLWTLVALALVVAISLTVLMRQLLSIPLKRLVEAIDDVTRGDLGRVVYRERNDELGALADRFNEMTRSLREAREEILVGVDAKLALEARLRHAEKLATIGQLAAGIAHEVGTPLNVIGGRARQLGKRAGDPAEVAKIAGIIASQTQRITRIIQQLLDFARRPQAQRTEVDLHLLARDCLDFLEHQVASAHIDAMVRPFVADSASGVDTPSIPIVRGDADQLQQVCLNLCMNAIQAMPAGGALELSTRSLVRRRPGLDAAEPGRYIVLGVADTGSGIRPEDRERIFEPFYSTKEDESEAGTGLGLSVSVGIVKDHDGWIEIDDRPGGGSIFQVFLPASEATELGRSAAG